MRHRITPLLVLAAALACSGDAGPEGDPLDPAFARVPGATAGGRGLTVTLSGSEEVPPNASTATGMFHMTLNRGLHELCYHLMVSGISTTVTNAHIHVGAAGVTGSPVVQLIPPVSGTSGTCVEVNEPLLSLLWDTPENYYVNVHSSQYPGGEVRGQLGW